MQFPDYNNIYGLLESTHSLTELARVLRKLSIFKVAEINLVTSQFDGTQKLSVHTFTLDLEIYPDAAEGIFLLSGAVAGAIGEVCDLTSQLHRHLRQAGFVHKLEVYDSQNSLSAEYK